MSDPPLPPLEWSSYSTRRNHKRQNDMEDVFKIRTPARSNTGTLGFKRHHILHLPLHLQHRNDETEYSHTKVAYSEQQDMDDANRRDHGDSPSQSNTQPMSRKGSLQVEVGSPAMCEKGISQAQRMYVRFHFPSPRSPWVSWILIPPFHYLVKCPPPFATSGPLGNNRCSGLHTPIPP